MTNPSHIALLRETVELLRKLKSDTDLSTKYVNKLDNLVKRIGLQLDLPENTKSREDLLLLRQSILEQLSDVSEEIIRLDFPDRP